MADKAVISLTTGMEDPEKVTVAFLVSVGAAEQGRETLMFLTKEAVRLATDGFATGTACEGCLGACVDASLCEGMGNQSCRRCFNLCNSFPTLFDAVDESESMELDTVPRSAYWDVVDHCYLCDMCYMTKCPYVPPHAWNVDFPHLMLRAKAQRFKSQGAPGGERRGGGACMR